MKAILILSDLQIKLVKALDTIHTIPQPDTTIALAWMGMNAGRIEGSTGAVSIWILLGSELIPHINIMLKKGLTSATLDALKEEGWHIKDTDNDVLLTCQTLHRAGIRWSGDSK